MKTKLLKILMLPVLGIILAVCSSNAILQAQVLQEWSIGTNSGSIDYYSVPGYYYYQNSMLELVYSPDTLPKEQAIIHSLSFYVYGQYNVTSSDPAVNPVKIFMANVPANYQAEAGTHCANIENISTLVYDGDMATPVVGEYMTFELTTPFVYEPGNKMVVFFKTERVGPETYGTGYFNIQTYYQSVPNCGYSAYYGGTPGQCPPLYQMTTNNSAATHIKFSYETIKMKYLNTELNTPMSTNLSDRRYAVLQANITTEKWAEPLKLSRLTVNTSGTSTNATISRMQLYYTSSSENFSDGDGILLATINSPVSGNNIFNIGRPQELTTGNNYFWVVYEVDVINTHCNAMLKASVPSLVISDGPKNSTKTPSTITSRSIAVNYSQISVNNLNTHYILCSDIIDTAVAISAQGTVRSYKWEVWNGETNSWEVYLDENFSNSATILKDNVLVGQDLYRVTLYPPLGECSLEPIQAEIDFSVTNNITSATAKITDEISPNENGLYVLEHGEIINIVAEVVGDVKEYAWQYSPDGEYWFNFSLLDMPTANTPNLSFIANESFGNIQVRMRAVSEDACSNSLYTDTFNIRVYRIPDFVLQPPKVVSLCPGEDFYVSLNFYGEEPISQRWYKDGYPLTSEVDTIYNKQELEFNNVTPEVAGKYYYKIVVPAVINHKIVNVTMVSDTVSLYVLPETEVITLTRGNVKASEGSVAILQVESSYATTSLDEPNGKFQWFRYNAITQQSTKLTNSYKIKGATSSILSISYIDNSDYTYNGDYYYCVVEGRCGGYQTAISEPIMLIPEQEVKIIKDPIDVVACPNDKKVTLTIQAFAENTSSIVYQWFYDNTELSDDAIFSGTNTNTLTINIDSSSNFTEEFYCKAWLKSSSYIAQSEPATVTVLEDYVPVVVSTDPPTDIIITKNVGDELVLTVETANPQSDIITWAKFNPNTSKYEPIAHTGTVFSIAELALSDAGIYTIIINTGCGIFVMDNEIAWNIEVVEPEDDEANSDASLADTYSNVLFDLEVAPNPAVDKLTVTYNSNIQSATNIQVLDLRGTLLLSFETNSTVGVNHYNIDLTKYNLSAGGYFIKLSNDKNYTTKSFIITK